jgi:hypothetical protein
MTQARWAAEVRRMNDVFPWFQALDRGDIVGFKGDMVGATGAKYSVEILACKRTYPALPPKIWLVPPFGSNRLADGSLCLQRVWRPDRDTFAQHVLYAAAYLEYQRKQAEYGQ